MHSLSMLVLGYVETHVNRNEVEAKKAIVRKYLELWDTDNLALADEVLAPHFVDHLHPELAPGPESVKKEVAAFRAAFPDAKGTVEQMIVEGDEVGFSCVLGGTLEDVFALC